MGGWAPQGAQVHRALLARRGVVAKGCRAHEDHKASPARLVYMGHQGPRGNKAPRGHKAPPGQPGSVQVAPTVVRAGVHRGQLVPLVRKVCKAKKEMLAQQVRKGLRVSKGSRGRVGQPASWGLVGQGGLKVSRGKLALQGLLARAGHAGLVGLVGPWGQQVVTCCGVLSSSK